MGDIGIRDNKIVLVGNANADADAEIVIDGSGLITCPGFIDTHTHADLSILDDPGAENFIMQGVTCVVGGHCGISPSPVGNVEFYNAYMSSIGVKMQRECKGVNGE